MILGLLLYVVIMSSGIGGLVYARNWARTTLDSEPARQQWEAWREETQRQHEGAGPVTRRPAKSPEPPALVLLRDHFPVCVSAWLLLGTGVLVPFYLMLHGVLRNPQPPVNSPAKTNVLR